MKNKNTNVLVVAVIGIVLSIASTSYAQSPIIYKNDSSHITYTVTSIESYSKIEAAMNTVLLKLQNVYRQYPNFEYKPLYNVYGELIAMSVNGVTESPVAKEVAFYLIELESLGNAMRFADMAYVPNMGNEKEGRLTRKEERGSRTSTEINLEPALANTESISLDSSENISRSTVKTAHHSY